MSYTIEIAVNDYTSAAAAVEGGADRIELCNALSEGGLTPSFGFIEKSRKNLDVPIFPIIRPRSGDFLYAEEEFDIIKRDVLLCKQAGCDGVVTGFLLPDGQVDKERITVIAELAHPMQVTFHRAFDRCLDPFVAMEDIIQAGCHRILTSAQKIKAIDGIELLKQLIIAAKGRIIIMPGSGVRKENIREIAEQTGARELHSSAKSLMKSKMHFLHPTFAALEEEYSVSVVDPQEVKALRKALLGSIQ